MQSQDIASAKPINKGWSGDEKYCVTDKCGKKYFLRISPHEKSGQRMELFEMLKRVEKLDVPMCRLEQSGVCERGVFALYTWIDGCDAEDAVALLPPERQYAMGVKAGKILTRIHSIPAPASQEDWHSRFNRKTDYKIYRYKECGIRFKGDDRVIDYLKRNRDVFKNRPQSFQHGDYHIGNMMISGGRLIIIDFDRFDFGDPWEEFNRIVWCAQSAPPFAAGMVDGYFNKNPLSEFWKCLAFYIASNTLSSVYWAMDYGQGEMEVMLRQTQDVISWYDGFDTVVPSWYITAHRLINI